MYGLKDRVEKRAAGIISEDRVLAPVTMYGCNKLYCEHLGAYYSQHYQRLGAEEHHCYVDFRSIRFPGIISSKTVPYFYISLLFIYSVQSLRDCLARTPMSCKPRNLI